MSRLKGLLFSARSLLRRASASEETAEEIAFHVDQQTEKHVAAGHGRATARRMALAEFGGVERWREETGDARAGRLLDTVAQDVRYAWRLLGHHRAFAAIAILTLAVGIGGVTAAATLVDRVLLHPLPYANPDRLVSLVQANDRADNFRFSIPNLADFTRSARSYEAIGGGMPTPFSVGEGDISRDVTGAQVVGEFFAVLGARPYMGRLLTIDDANVGAPPVALLSYELWQSEYGGDRDIIGRSISLNTGHVTVIGVLTPHFEQPVGAQLWTTCRWCLNPPPGTRATISADVIAKLRPDVTLAQAEAEANLIGARIHAEYPLPSENQMATVHARPLQGAVVESARQPLWMLTAAVGCILLIGCANLANANLARNATRIHELRIRVALGAGRRRIIQQLAIESLVLAVIGGVIGIALAWGAVRLVVAHGALYLPRLSEVSVGLDSALVALGVAVTVVLLIGLLPAILLSRRGLREGMGAPRTVGTGTSMLVRNLLIASEVALSLVLAVGATLTVRSLQNVEAQSIGVDTRGLTFASPALSRRKYADDAQVFRFYEEAIAEIAALPGVDGAALVATPPLGVSWQGFIQIEGYPDDARTGAQYNLVDEHYFRTVGLPLLRGRLLTAADDSSAEQVTVVDEAMADRFWPDVDPIGKRFKTISIGDQKDRWLTVVGLVRNVRTWALENEFTPTHYVSARQRPGLAGASSIIVRSKRPASAIMPAVRAAIKLVDADVRVTVSTFDERFRLVTSERRAKTNLLSSFAAVALLLAAIGVYGVLSYVVALRTREIGVRMALGANRGRVVKDVLRQLLVPVGSGIIVGLGATILLSKVFESLVFNVSPTAPGALAMGTSILLFLVLLAALVPARRAARLDPLTALRAD